ncbi:MAG TPA: hypothetical protein VD999_06185 [Vitreimonas sp.]|nr:hypothetical protein [Vitreimonas sp.]
MSHGAKKEVFSNGNGHHNGHQQIDIIPSNLLKTYGIDADELGNEHHNGNGHHNGKSTVEALLPSTVQNPQKIGKKHKIHEQPLSTEDMFLGTPAEQDAYWTQHEREYDAILDLINAGIMDIQMIRNSENCVTILPTGLQRSSINTTSLRASTYIKDNHGNCIYLSNTGVDWKSGKNTHVLVNEPWTVFMSFQGVELELGTLSNANSSTKFNRLPIEIEKKDTLARNEAAVTLDLYQNLNASAQKTLELILSKIDKKQLMHITHAIVSKYLENYDLTLSQARELVRYYAQDYLGLINQVLITDKRVANHKIKLIAPEKYILSGAWDKFTPVENPHFELATLRRLVDIAIVSNDNHPETLRAAKVISNAEYTYSKEYRLNQYTFEDLVNLADTLLERPKVNQYLVEAIIRKMSSLSHDNPEIARIGNALSKAQYELRTVTHTSQYARVNAAVEDAVFSLNSLQVTRREKPMNIDAAEDRLDILGLSKSELDALVPSQAILSEINRELGLSPLEPAKIYPHKELAKVEDDELHLSPGETTYIALATLIKTDTAIKKVSVSGTGNHEYYKVEVLPGNIININALPQKAKFKGKIQVVAETESGQRIVKYVDIAISEKTASGPLYEQAFTFASEREAALDLTANENGSLFYAKLTNQRVGMDTELRITGKNKNGQKTHIAMSRVTTEQSPTWIIPYAALKHGFNGESLELALVSPQKETAPLMLKTIPSVSKDVALELLNRIDIKAMVKEMKVDSLDELVDKLIIKVNETKGEERTKTYELLSALKYYHAQGVRNLNSFYLMLGQKSDLPARPSTHDLLSHRQDYLRNSAAFTVQKAS